MELVLLIYNVHPYVSLKNLGNKCEFLPKIWVVYECHEMKKVENH